MSGKVFIDTNLWIYFYADEVKGPVVRQFVDKHYENVIISTQVVGEFFHVVVKKGLKDKGDAKKLTDDLREGGRGVRLNSCCYVSRYSSTILPHSPSLFP
jgi:predicted nucleic acid-binding protein